MGEDPLVIRLEQIGADGFDLAQTVTVEWLREALGADSPYRPTAPAKLTAHLQRIDGPDGPGSVVHVRGRLAAVLAADCSRCVEQTVVSFDAPLEVAIFPKDQEPPAASDGEIRGEDMGVATYTPLGIDLATLVRDEVFLELPMNPLCKDACSGLCSQCGTNLNQQTCQCGRPEESWNTFRALKLD